MNSNLAFTARLTVQLVTDASEQHGLPLDFL